METWQPFNRIIAIAEHRTDTKEALRALSVQVGLLICDRICIVCDNGTPVRNQSTRRQHHKASIKHCK